MEKKQLPVGRDNFEDIIRRDLYYVDKTELIEEMFANESSVYLFTRPRRFGKSLNMSMLNYFFSLDSDKTLFDGLKISKNKEICEKYQNKYPVISMTLKGVQGNNFTFAKNMFQSKNGLQFYEKYGKIIEFEHVYEYVTECTERKKIT